MAIGFRKSLFGFNTNDVINYIENMHNTFRDKQNKLSDELDNVSKELSLSKENYEVLSKEKDEIASKLNEFEEKLHYHEKMQTLKASASAVREDNEKINELLDIIDNL